MEKVNGRKWEMHRYVTVMKEIITWIKRMVTVYSHGKVAIFTKETIKMMKEMAMERCSGQMVQFTKDNGDKVFNMVLVK